MIIIRHPFQHLDLLNKWWVDNQFNGVLLDDLIKSTMMSNNVPTPPKLQHRIRIIFNKSFFFLFEIWAMAFLLGWSHIKLSIIKQDYEFASTCFSFRIWYFHDSFFNKFIDLTLVKYLIPTFKFFFFFFESNPTPANKLKLLYQPKWFMTPIYKRDVDINTIRHDQHVNLIPL